MRSMTKTRETVGKLFRVSDNRIPAIDPLAGIYPSNNAPVIRIAEDGEREGIISSWGFVLPQKDKAPKRVTNFRDDNLGSPFWRSSFETRRCLVPTTSFAEPKGRSPAIWHWFALGQDRPLFAFAGIWRSFRGAVKKDGPVVDLEVHSFMTTTPNPLVATIHPNRMPVILTTDEEFDIWLNGSADEARSLVRSYPAENMAIVQSAAEKVDMLDEC
ncbi:SOS response-associated peptidase [Filomicrobium insigne]|nr:SOS response-associated peptidase family protein [Filomicrobium insigne]